MQRLYSINSLRPGDAYMRQSTIIASDDGLSPGRRQAIIRSSAGILLIHTFGTNFSEIVSEIQTFSFKEMHLKISGKWRGRPFCLGLNVLTASDESIPNADTYMDKTHPK